MRVHVIKSFIPCDGLGFEFTKLLKIYYESNDPDYELI